MMEIRFAKRSDGDALRRIYDGEPAPIRPVREIPAEELEGILQKYRQTLTCKK